MSTPSVTVLASGGLDSSTCIAYYRAQGLPVRALWVDYGQMAAAAEESAVERLTVYYGIQLRKLCISGLVWQQEQQQASVLYEFQGRNLTLAALALNAAPAEAGLIALGVHAGTPFADCGSSFTELLDKSLAVLSGGLIRLDCPFLYWSKLDVGRYAQACGVPVQLTHSCMTSVPGGCQECEKCRDIQTLFSALQVESPDGADEPSTRR